MSEFEESSDQRDECVDADGDEDSGDGTGNGATMTGPDPDADRSPPDQGSVFTREQDGLTRKRLVRAGVFAWSLVGLAVVFVIFVRLLDRFQLVVIPLLIALFPAALLSPLSGWLKRRGMRPLAAASLVVVVFLVGVAALVSTLVWLIVGELEDLVDTLQDAYSDLAESAQDRFGVDLPNIDELIENIDAWARNIDAQGMASDVAFTTIEVVSGILLGIIALLFYLKDGERMAGVALQLTPERLRDDVAEIFRRVWSTLGGYFRGQLIVAAVDAVFIGLGLAVLGVPLALPLAVLVFFGGLFPIVGAFTAGGLAVLVALADGGIGLALAVLALNVIVQQLEGNFLEPLIVGRATDLHPLVVLTSLTAGAVTLGVLGAFLAVPLAASVVRAVSYVLERDPELAVEYGAELPKLDDYVVDTD